MKRVFGAAAAILLVFGAVTALGPITFEDIAQKAGITFVLDNSATPNKNQPESMPGGVALIDYDNDGLLDIYFVNAAVMPSLRKESPKFWNRLYHNNGDGTFTDVTEKAGVKGEGYGIGAAVGDYDNDGWPDLFIANVNDNILFHNNHDGTFTDVTAKAKLTGAKLNGWKMFSASAGWFDYDNDGNLDLFVSNYCKWEPNKDPFCGPNPNVRAYCHPKNYAPIPNALYHNNGDGTFTDVSHQFGIDKFLGKGMGVAFADYDHDGFMDVIVANDNAPNMLFHNLAGKGFEEVALQVGVAYPESGAFISGMGIDFRDVDNDGWPDVWHTAIEGETFPLFHHMGKSGEFTDVTGPAALGRPTREMSGWSNAIADFDNDGWKDLFVARGNVQDNLSLMSLRQADEPNSILRNLGNGKFADVTASAGADLNKPGNHRGFAFGDLDNDGRLDAVVTAIHGRAKVFRNTSGGGNHWILLHLIGTKSNRMGIGAQVKVTREDGLVEYNEVSTSTGFASSSDHRVHFGLGQAKLLKEVEIAWPSRIRQVLKNVKVDQILKIVEPVR